jgi:predicted nucleotidyltransferase
MLSEDKKQESLRHAHRMCAEHGASLLFLTLFGSTLYGTEKPGTSDLDVRGVFLPSRESLILNKAPKSLHFSTGNKECRNLAGDVDIDLWSVQHWLLKLLPSGDTGALDVLFAPSHAACTLYRHPALDAVFAGPLRLMDTGQGRAYAEYSLGQAKKYGIKGSRVGALKAVRTWLQTYCPNPHPRERLAEYWEKKPSVKAWLYVLRPLLAMRWIELGKGVAPMRFDLLMDGVVDDASLRAELHSLVETKKRGSERDAFTPPPLIAAFVEKETSRLQASPPPLLPETEKADLDALFKAALFQAWQRCAMQCTDHPAQNSRHSAEDVCAVP